MVNLHFILRFARNQLILQFFGRASFHAHCFLGELEDIFFKNETGIRAQGPRLGFVRGPQAQLCEVAAIRLLKKNLFLITARVKKSAALIFYFIFLDFSDFFALNSHYFPS